MKHLKKHKIFIKYSCLAVIGASTGWVCYQIRKTHEILDNLLDTSVLNVMEAASHEGDKSSMEFLETRTFNNHTSALSRTWQSLKFSYARRLLTLANNDSKAIRVRAVRSLAKVQNLDNWHCSLLANMIDAKTAVGLARTENCDIRLQMEPPLRYLTYNRSMIVNAMRELLINLYNKSQHPCMGYFISKIFIDDHDIGRSLDHETASMELNKFIQSASDILPMCLESLLHHSTIERYAKDIVELNGLPLLLEIHNRFKTNNDVSETLCKIISYLSFYPELLEPIFKSGWIGILAEWVKHDDIRISVPAARALANLDLDDNSKYTRHLYLLHPSLRSEKQQTVDVVFVHGLLGGVFYTWRQRNSNQVALRIIGKKKRNQKGATTTSKSNENIYQGSDPVTRQYIEDLEEINNEICQEYELVWDDVPLNTNDLGVGPYSCPASNTGDYDQDLYTFCWPKDWLGEDCKNLRIIGINYDTSLSMWAPICLAEKVKFNLEERSDLLISRLMEAGIGTRPIVWVTHSMGGLIVKNILCKAIESQNEATKNICLNTKGIVFYSTPHKGSRLANLSQATALLLWPSVEVQELREDSPQLKRIHNQFIDIVKNVVPMKVVTFVETKSTIVTAMKFNFLLVEPHSGNPGVGEYYEVPQDHLGICKPVSRHSFIYQKVLHLLKIISDENK